MRLYELGFRTYLLDGDILKKGFNIDLSYSLKDRKENIRRAIKVAKILLDAELVVICSFITPLKEHKEMIKSLIPADRLTFIYCKCPIHMCEKRDPKNLHQKAKLGLVDEFTGLTSPFEDEPLNERCITHLTDNSSVEECVEQPLSGST